MTKITEEKLYVYIAIVVGMLLIFIIPPFVSPDEDSHFIKSYLVSQGKLYPTTNKKGVVGNKLPQAMVSYIISKRKFSSNFDEKYTYHNYFNEQFDKLDYNSKKFISYSTSQVFPYIYAAPAFGILTAKMMAIIFDIDNTSPAYLLQFARLFTLLFSITLTYFAIKITPVFKKTMFTVALMPMTLFICSMVSYDAVLIPLSLLGIAILLRLIYDNSIKTVSIKQLIILTVIGIILFNVKTIYSFIYVLLLFIPKEKFGTTKDKTKSIIIMGLTIILVYILARVPQYLLTNVAASGNSASSKQITFILKNPIKYLGYILYNIRSQRLFFINTTVGCFGLLDVYLPLFIIAIFLVNLFLISLAEGSTDKYKINYKIKLALLGLVILCVIAIFTVMYISWTSLMMKTGQKDILGVQGRYFIPLIFPVLLVFSNSKIKANKLFKTIKNNYFLIPTVSLIVSIAVCIFRFW